MGEEIIQILLDSLTFLDSLENHTCNIIKWSLTRFTILKMRFKTVFVQKIYHFEVSTICVR